MLRVFQAAVVLMGVFLLLIPVAIHEREDVGALQQILVTQRASNGIDDYYILWLLQPESGRRVLLASAWEYHNVIGWDAYGALIYEEGGNDEVPVLMRVKQNGRDRRVLSEWTVSNYQQAVQFTPDRQSVVVLESGTSGVVSVRTDGTGRKVVAQGLTEPLIHQWVLSPDGQWVAFRTDNVQYDILWARLDGTEIHFLPHDFNGAGPRPVPLDWVAMAEGLIVECYPKVCWFDRATGTMRRITTSDDRLAEDYVGVYEAAGLVLIFTKLDDGSSRTLHAFDSATGQPLWSLDALHYNGLSPDNRWVLHQRTDNQWGLLDVVTGQSHALSLPFRPDEAQGHLWSPDGQRLVQIWENNTTGQREIRGFDLATGQTHLIWQGWDVLMSTMWSTDSDQIFIHSYGLTSRAISRLTWIGDFRVVTDSAIWGDHYLETTAPAIEQRAVSPTGLTLAGLGLIGFGIVLAIIRRQVG